MRLCSRGAGPFFITTFKECQYTKLINDLTESFSAVFPFVPAKHTKCKRLYSEDRKITLIDNISPVVTKAETIQECSSTSHRSLQRLWKSRQNACQLFSRLFTEDRHTLATVSVEQQLRTLMQIWELEEAVNVLKTSMRNGADPNRIVIQDLLQQIANIGEVDCLLDLYDFFKDRGQATSLRLYHYLCDAYFNSGRIEEGVSMLRLVYHSMHDFKNVDLFFTLLTTMIIKHFVHHLHLIESFICDLEESDPPVLSARASLWRCFVLTEKFKAADDLLVKHNHLNKMVPEQVTKIVQFSSELDYNKSTVLHWLLHLQSLRARLKASVFDMLVHHKSQEGEWLQVLDLLSTAMDQGIQIQNQTVQVFLTRFFSQLSHVQVQQLSDWAEKMKKLPSASDR